MYISAASDSRESQSIEEDCEMQQKYTGKTKVELRAKLFTK